MIIYILGQSPVGSTKRLLATDTCMYLQQAARKVIITCLLVFSLEKTCIYCNALERAG